MPDDAASAASSPVSSRLRARPPKLEAAIGWLAIAGLVFLIGAVTVLAVESRDRFIRETEARAGSAAHVLSEHAARLFDAADLLVVQAAQQSQDMSWDEVASSRRMWEYLRAEQARLPFLDAVWLNDAAGDLRLSTVAFPTPLSNARDRDSFTAHLTGPERPHISELIVGRITHKPTFLVSRRLTDRSGNFRGVASVTVDPAYFNEFYRRLDLTYTPDILLFRADDLSMLVRQPWSAPSTPAPLPDAGRREVAAHPDSGIALSEGAIFAHRRVENWPIYVAVRIDLAPVLEAWSAGLLPYAALALAAGVALLALSAFAFRQARASHRVQEELEERVRERTALLQAALEQRDTVLAQKDLLMREVNHRVKNSLQMVSSLLTLQGQSTGDADLRARLQEAGGRVRAVSDIHQLLYKVEDVRVIPFHDYLKALCQELERSALAQSSDWRLELDVQPVEVPTDQAVPLGLIANELLMNVIKHAYPKSGPKPIAVGLSRTDGTVRLTIGDRGVGMPDGFDWRRSRSLGMRLIHALSKQLGATLAVESHNPGASFTIQVPLDLPA